MTELFGGLAAFYSAYEAAWPLDAATARGRIYTYTSSAI